MISSIHFGSKADLSKATLEFYGGIASDRERNLDWSRVGATACGLPSLILTAWPSGRSSLLQMPEDAPRGVEIADANELLPESRIIRHRKTGSPSLFTNLLRYEILGTNLGLYVDCDVFCIRPIADADYIFGWENLNSINGAVLKLPPECPALTALSIDQRHAQLCAALAQTSQAPPLGMAAWPCPDSFARGLALGERRSQGANVTPYAKLHGIDRFASPIDRFYPLHWSHVGQLFNSALSLKDLTTHRTDALHLYHSNFRHLRIGELFSTSVVGRIMADGN